MKVVWDTKSAAKTVSKQAANLEALRRVRGDARRVQNAAPAALGFLARSSVDRSCEQLAAALARAATSLQADGRELAKRVAHMQAVDADTSNYKAMSKWDIFTGTMSGTGSGLKDIFWDEPVATIKDPNASTGAKAWAVFNIVTLPLPVSKVTKLGVVVKAAGAGRAFRAGSAGIDAVSATKRGARVVEAARAAKAATAALPAAARVRQAVAAIREGWATVKQLFVRTRARVVSTVSTKAYDKVLALPGMERVRKTVAWMNRLANSDVRVLRPRTGWRVNAVGSRPHHIREGLLAAARESKPGSGIRDAVMGTQPGGWTRPQFFQNLRGPEAIRRLLDDAMSAPVRRQLVDRRTGAFYQERVMPNAVGLLPNGKPTNIVTIRLDGSALTDIHPGTIKFPARDWYNPLPTKPKYIEFGPAGVVTAPKLWAITQDDDGRIHVTGDLRPSVTYPPVKFGVDEVDRIQAYLDWRRQQGVAR